MPALKGMIGDSSDFKRKDERMYEVNAEFKGLVPVMFDRFYNIEETEGKAKKKAKDLWREQLKYKMYMDSKGVYVPTDNIRMMLIGNKHRKGAAKILGSFVEKAKGTEYVEFCESCVWVMGPKDPQRVYFSPHRSSYDDYDERSFINATGSRSLTRRPILTLPWSVAFRVQVTDDQMHESKLREMFQLAGLRCGLGAYGPTFGRCELSLWEPI